MSRRLLRPKRWSPPPAPQRRTNDALLPLRRLELPGAGPEDVVLDNDGRIVTGLADGRLVRIDPASGAVETIANTGGRPLGLEVERDGSVLVCDSVRGLLRVSWDGSVEELVGAVDGVPLNFASNVVTTDDGTIYFSASTRDFDLEHYTGDLLEHAGTGRLFRRKPDGEVETLLDGLHFANGVALAPDGSCLVVAQTGSYCLTRYWLTGPAAGTSDILIDNLPGFPDNISGGSDGLIWVSIPSPRDALLDRLLPLPGLLRQIVWLLPTWLQPKPKRTVWVLAVSFAGAIEHDLQAPAPITRW